MRFIQEENGGVRMIRKAEETDLSRIFELFAVARAYMKATGNGTQWGDTKPEESAIREHLSKGNLYVVVLENIIEAVFAMVPGQDPTYAYIEDGQWLNEESYVTLHAVASSGNRKGMFHLISEFAKETSDNVRIDTHEKNGTMQHCIHKEGFLYCGIIYLADGNPRMAYQWSSSIKKN